MERQPVDYSANKQIPDTSKKPVPASKEVAGKQEFSREQRDIKKPDTQGSEKWKEPLQPGLNKEQTPKPH